MRVLFFLLISQASAWCFFYDKQGTLKKIEQNLAVLGRKDVDRDFFKTQTKKMPRVFSWAVDQIGVERAFKDCDENDDGTITLEEMAHDRTCLDSCFKLGIVNIAL